MSFCREGGRRNTEQEERRTSREWRMVSGKEQCAQVSSIVLVCFLKQQLSFTLLHA